MPEAMLAWGRHSQCAAERTPELAAGGSDNVMIHFMRRGAFQMHQTGGPDVICESGHVYIDPNEVAGTSRFLAEGTEAFYISLPRSTVAGLRGINDHLRLRVDATPQWRLLQCYGEALFADMDMLTPEQIALSSRHLQDLAISAFSARDPGPLAETMAARLRLIKEDIASLLHQPDLTPELIAARHGISSRYLRMIFASEATTFRAYVLQQRLHRAHATLWDPAAIMRTISDVAGATGFSDLSWFNQSYRRRYGQSPRETRAEAMTARLTPSPD
ncbi:helix-turn-helix domain-containing protein [Ponticoccus alexandrii]|uniref:Helix-turn-helix domain-containing protein n=2 Tax=Ponticoccus alexandrii TaxID=1943633 RepID=A0ABX7FAE1_9RHOB|nr:helix-turn-helix domain-containing protein [Ponticoccus alexandrii]